MVSEALEKARAYETEHSAAIPRSARPGFHLSARCGWMNDPNGFSFYDGAYHLFYQYHPYDSHWGPMHWGHAVSTDLLRWEYLPAVMAPDSPWDECGCYSGSAITLPDGRHALVYTGVAQGHIQAQCLAIGDGREYEKYAGNPVITRENLPAGGSPLDFRDPKIWREPNGRYRLIAANDAADGGGQMLIFESTDLIHWRRVGILAANRGRLGRMWECPDFFRLDGTWVLLGSAQDMLPKGLEYHNGNGTFCFLGDYDPEHADFTERGNHAVDYGIDFYAPQTILAPDGRRIMIGWMQNWDTCNLHVKSTPWYGQMSLPRELHVKNGRLWQTPIREVEALRSDEVVLEDVGVENGEITLPGVTGRMVDLELEITPGEGGYERFAVRFAKNDDFQTSVSYRPHERTLKVDRKFSGSRRAIIHQRRARVEQKEGKLTLRLIIDRFSVEVFVNGGEKVLSATISTDPSAGGIAFFADGAVRLNLRKYTLREA